MKTIIAGSRDCSDISLLHTAVKQCGWVPSVVVSGTARGADRLGELWAAKRGVPVEKYPADWDKHGKSAGYKRNELMAANAEALIALWDGESRGTKHMIDLARRKGLRVFVMLSGEDIC
jgi:predicted Rossmann fold nucleotide-binding protein DprA/Smf involved in DNA uptake